MLIIFIKKTTINTVCNDSLKKELITDYFLVLFKLINKRLYYHIHTNTQRYIQTHSHPHIQTHTKTYRNTDTNLKHFLWSKLKNI